MPDIHRASGFGLRYATQVHTPFRKQVSPMIELTINGQKRRIDAEGDTPLLWVLRDDLGMTGTKYGAASRSVAPVR
jgi:hypothetical protein